MYLVAIAWIYVVFMMSVAEVMHPDGTLLGGIITFVLYGVLPLSIVLYIMGARLRARKPHEPPGP
jgi:membrane protein implicated in regulation of membrane protease activity